MEKRRPTHDLQAIKDAFASPAGLNRTKVAARDAASLGMDSSDVVAVILALRHPTDFEKSATAHHDNRQWHDSHWPVVGGMRLYLKFTRDEAGRYLLTSFKEADT